MRQSYSKRNALSVRFGVNSSKRKRKCNNCNNHKPAKAPPMGINLNNNVINNINTNLNINNKEQEQVCLVLRACLSKPSHDFHGGAHNTTIATSCTSAPRTTRRQSLRATRTFACSIERAMCTSTETTVTAKRLTMDFATGHILQLQQGISTPWRYAWMETSSA
ncbi:hypothetical protein PPROV_000980200 [Pycnococcus provasolii]|uniref:Uncharacterized protein n=1 Tax=Pycnococcus provasolii TaxID=41880 RepID=A0A830HVC6_9CHLO|nr:hypothetical protein PPROV_000980200 [Pycnococcus provasolii]